MSKTILIFACAAAACAVVGCGRGDAERAKPKRVAIVTMNEHPIRGYLEGLADEGFAEDGSLEVKRFVAQGDLVNLNLMAAQAVDGGFDVVITAGTPCLQAVARANAAGKVPHVFGFVTDPGAAGAGIGNGDPRTHPAHLTGVVATEPVERTFATAIRCGKPEVVGVVWNPSEGNSQVQLRKAREVCAKHGIKLIEKPATSSADVGEAALALAADGVQAIWMPGDSTVSAASATLIRAAATAKIPVFANTRHQPGILFSISAPARKTARKIGTTAGRILKGTSPANIAIADADEYELAVDPTVPAKLKERWSVPDLGRTE